MSATHKRLGRRTATSVMAGNFDQRPKHRDVLTSLLNGVHTVPKIAENDEHKAKRRKERKERKKEKERARAAARQSDMTGIASTSATTLDSRVMSISAPHFPLQLPIPNAATASFWKVRPTIQLPAMQRSQSISPSPTSSPRFSYTPASTPGPSISSSTSRTSSKRPRTPDDDEQFDSAEIDHPVRPPRKKRPAAKKGWKGWVEGSPTLSAKLINLDSAPVLNERRTRSGKNFDAYTDGAQQ